METYKKCDKCPSPAVYYLQVEKAWTYLCKEHFDASGVSKYELDGNKRKSCK